MAVAAAASFFSAAEAAEGGAGGGGGGGGWGELLLQGLLSDEFLLRAREITTELHCHVLCQRGEEEVRDSHIAKRFIALPSEVGDDGGIAELGDAGVGSPPAAAQPAQAPQGDSATAAAAAAGVVRRTHGAAVRAEAATAAAAAAAAAPDWQAVSSSLPRLLQQVPDLSFFFFCSEWGWKNQRFLRTLACLIS